LPAGKGTSARLPVDAEHGPPTDGPWEDARVEVAVIGGGIVGCAAAALLAEAGARVTLHERDRIAAGASGRNQGVLQHPLDDVLAPLYEESLRLHAETAPSLGLDRAPDGLLLVSHDPSGPARLVASLGQAYPELSPAFLEDACVEEPALAAGIAGCRLETGHQIPPAAGTDAWAARAATAGARIELGRIVSAADIEADTILVAAGPWTPAPVSAIWGVTAQIRLERPPRHALEEAVVEDLTTMTGEVQSAFTAVTAVGVTTVGATFLPDEPDHRAVAPSLLERARPFLPGVAEARLAGSRACARPVSSDGHPLIGRLPGRDNCWIATGNGMWGMSCGPATARIAVDAMLGRAAVPSVLDAARGGLS
jgi:glycine/D-amino acid oxidase-like deaminating enzyme